MSFFSFAADVQAQAEEVLPDSTEIVSYEPVEENQIAGKENRNNLDFASVLSLLGVGLLKFVDDKLKVKFKGKFSVYKRYLLFITVLFSLLELAIVVCYFGKLGSPSFGNLKNVILGFIPVVFCVLTLATEKNESNPIVLSQAELDVRINDFTSSGMSPLGMIVGDMDFFGKVYGNSTKKKDRKNDITNNSQLKAILDNNIDRIEIVCKPPKTNEAKERIGYLQVNFESRFHIRFFNEDKIPIPQMRGRIMYKQSEQFVVITKKIKKPSKYEYSEYPVSSLPGGLFADLWHTVWGSSLDNNEILDECKQVYSRIIKEKK